MAFLASLPILNGHYGEKLITKFTSVDRVLQAAFLTSNRASLLLAVSHVAIKRGISHGRLCAAAAAESKTMLSGQTSVEHEANKR